MNGPFLTLVPTSPKVAPLTRPSVTTFHAASKTVEMRTASDGSVWLDMAQVEALLNIYEKEVCVAEAQASHARRMFNALFDARCLVVDRNGGVPPKDAA